MKQNNGKSSKSKIFLDSLIVNASSLIEKVFFFIANIVIARYLSIEHFGEYSTALSYATFFSLMSDIGINVTLVRALNLEYQYFNYHFTNAFLLKAVLSIVMYVTMVISVYFTGYSQDVIYLTLILGVVRIGNEFMKTYYAVDEARQKFVFPSVANSVYVIFFLGGIISVVLYKGSYYHICMVRLIIVILFIVFLSFHTFKKFSFKFNKKLCLQFIKNAIPFSIFAVLWNFILRINAIVISIVLGTTPVGIFNNAILFIDTLSIIPANLRRIMMPVLYKALEQKDKNKFQFTFEIMSKYFGIISFYIMLVLFLFANDLIMIIFGKRYFDSIQVLRVLSLSVPFVFNIATIIIVGLDKQSVLTKILVIATVVNIFANIILIHFFNLLGASLAVIVTYGVIFVLGHVYLNTREHLRLKKIVVYYIKFVIISLLCVFVYDKFFNNNYMKFYFSSLLITIIYALCILLFIIERDDIRIIKDMLAIKK